MTNPLLSSQRYLFSIPDDITYLNCAYLSPQLNMVTEVGQKAVLFKQSPWQIMPADFFPKVDKLRRLLATLIDAQPGDIAIIPSTSYGISTAAQNLPVQKGQVIILLAEEFPSNVYRWHELAKQTGAVIKTISRQVDDNWTREILKTIDNHTAIVSLPHCHWSDGSMIDLESVSRACKQHHAALVVDATQSLGAMPFSVKEIAPDFMVAAGYKWLLGPYGLSVMYVAPHRQQGLPIEYNWITRKNSQDFSKLTQYQTEYEGGASRYDMGERTQFIHVPMLCAALTQLLNWGVKNIYHTLQNYNNQLAQGMNEMGIECVNAQHRAGHILGLKMSENMDMSALSAQLRQEKIYISTPGQSVRISPHLYNVPKDQERLLDVLRAQAARPHFV